MDPFTHAVAGAVVARVVPRPPRSTWFVPLAALISVLPDLDILAAHTPLEYLLLHRGFTHALPVLPLEALLLVLPCRPLWRRGVTGAWRKRSVWLFAFLLLLMHVWLDCVTTYGTMIFQPFSDYRLRLNGLFIVDALLLAPLVVVLAVGRTRFGRSLAMCGLCWLLLYPAVCVGVRDWQEDVLEARLRNAGVVPQALCVLPDVGAPLFWRALYVTDAAYTPPPAATGAEREAGFAPVASAQTLHHQSVGLDGAPRGEARQYPLLDAGLRDELRRQSPAVRVFFDFCLLPTLERCPQPAGADVWRFFDLRFASALPAVEALMARLGRGEPPFQLWVRQRGGIWQGWRMQGGLPYPGDDWRILTNTALPGWWRWFTHLPPASPARPDPDPMEVAP